MKKLRKGLWLQVVLLILSAFWFRAVTVKADILPADKFQVTATATPTITNTPFLTATPVYNWTQPTNVTPTINSVFVTQTSQAQLTQFAGSATPNLATPIQTDLTPTETFPSEPAFTTTPTIPSPTSTRAVIGEGRLLVGTDRYDKNNYWAIPVGLLATFAIIALAVLIFTKRR